MCRTAYRPLSQVDCETPCAHPLAKRNSRSRSNPPLRTYALLRELRLRNGCQFERSNRCIPPAGVQACIKSAVRHARPHLLFAQTVGVSPSISLAKRSVRFHVVRRLALRSLARRNHSWPWLQASNSPKASALEALRLEAAAQGTPVKGVSLMGLQLGRSKKQRRY